VRKLDEVEKKTCAPALARTTSVAQLPMSDSPSLSPSAESSAVAWPTTAKRSGRRASTAFSCSATRRATAASAGSVASTRTSPPVIAPRRPRTKVRRRSER